VPCHRIDPGKLPAHAPTHARDRRRLHGGPLARRTHRGIEIGLHLTPGLSEENFVAEAICNLAAFRLQKERGERLVWQVLRVESESSHHYRLVLRHPERVLDVGIKSDLRPILDALSALTVEELRREFELAAHEGLAPIPLRNVHEDVDFWRDDFWNWIG
jgi:hypothetical protein